MRARDAYLLGLGGSVLVAFLVGFLGLVLMGLATHDVADRAALSREEARDARAYWIALGLAFVGVAGFVAALVLARRRPDAARACAAVGFVVLAGYVVLLVALKAGTGWP